MGPELLGQQIQNLQSRADRYRRVGRLLGDAEVCATLNRLATELDDAVQKLETARALIDTTIVNSHRLWAGLSFESLMVNLRAQEALPTSSQLAKAEDWRELARLWAEEIESSRNHPDKKLLAACAFDIAQFAEKLVRDAESKIADVG